LPAGVAPLTVWELGGQLEAALHHQFLERRHEASAAVGKAEVNHEAAVDQLGLRHPISRELGALYMQLLDGKGSLKAQEQRVRTLQLRIGPRPRWMLYHRGGNPSMYTAESGSALALLRECNLGDDTLTIQGGRLHADKLLLLDLHRTDDLNDEKLKQMRRRWDQRYDEYRKQVRLLHPERESARQQRPCEGGESRAPQDGNALQGHDGGAIDEDDHERMDRYFAMVAQMRERWLLAPYADARAKCALSEPAELLAEASALYEAVVKRAIHAVHDDPNPTYYVSFAWHMAGDLLLYIRRARLSRARNPTLALFTNF